MDKLLTRGYVTPEDFTGTDRERLQTALDVAAKLDLNKVVLEGDYACDGPLTLPAGLYLVVKGTLQADLQSKKLSNYSFEQKHFFLEGPGKVVGDIYFYNTRWALMEDLTVDGSVTYEFSREMRMEKCTVTGGVNVGRGCAVGIFQYNTLGAVQVSTEVFCGDIVPAKNPMIENILVRDTVLTQGSVTFQASQTVGMQNVQADHITAPGTAAVIGTPGEDLNPALYFNLTLTDLNAPEKVRLNNPVKHAYIRD